METIETIIVGGGQAGLATSYHLKKLGREHLVFDAAEKPAHAWRNDRWDLFTFVTPNWTIQLPGAEYDGDDPDGYLPKEEIVAYFEGYIEKYALPVRFKTSVLEVGPMDGGRYQVKTEAGIYQAKNVVIATGSFQKPKIPAFSAEIPAEITQLHSGHYRNPKQLSDGTALVVGAGQSGLQIAEELYQSGRKVYLSAGFAPRAPRRYRGRDVFAWLVDAGFFEQTPDKLPSLKARFGANPQLSGKDGGHALNLHQFARDGVTLLGHIAGAQDGRVTFKLDLKETLARTDKAEKDICAMIDRYIEAKGINAPQETLPELQDGYAAEEIAELDLKSAKVKTVIWAMGYTFDYSLVKLPVTDEDGFPITQRGVTEYPGLYFVGMNWLSKRKSTLLLGVKEDVESIIAGMTK
ncbi:MAG: NAD(P)-binding domain-containing protein [Chloroflexi bacterium]|nr:NAD(P)-binding domain-containing protein [Chloroflexota bacterium]